MKYIILIMFSVFAVGCSSSHDPVSPEPLPVIEEGIYYFDEVESGVASGAIAINVDYDGTVRVVELEKFISQNPNGSYGVHPRVNLNGLDLLEDGRRLYDARNVNYSNNNDLEKDTDGSDLSSGSKYTIYDLYIGDDGKLKLNITVFSSSSSSGGSINNIVIERLFTEV